MTIFNISFQANEERLPIFQTPNAPFTINNGNCDGTVTDNPSYIRLSLPSYEEAMSGSFTSIETPQDLQGSEKTHGNT